jgi:hypothetical protein
MAAWWEHSQIQFGAAGQQATAFVVPGDLVTRELPPGTVGRDGRDDRGKWLWLTLGGGHAAEKGNACVRYLEIIERDDLLGDTCGDSGTGVNPNDQLGPIREQATWNQQ